MVERHGGVEALGTLPATAKTPRRVAKEEAACEIDPGSLPVLSNVTNLDFDVTENCNLGCLYCFKGEKYTQNMTLSGMKRAFEWLLDASGMATSVNCNFMGGEPTMRFKQIKEFVPWVRRRAASVKKQVTFSMTTNLTLFTPEIRSFVDQYGFGVLMSIDGCPEVQDAQRPSKNGKPMSQIVETWAKSMLRTRPACQVRATIHPDYVSRLLESVKYFHSIGFREAAVSASEYQDWRPEHFDTLREQYRGIVDFIVDVHGDGGEFNLTVFKYYIKSLIYPRSGGREVEVQRQPCGAGRGYMMVDYTGDIWPCHRFDGADEAAGAGGQFRLGNIYQPGFNTPLQKAFLDFDHSTMHKESCTRCPVNPVCGGYCPAANLSDAGSIYTPHDAFCEWSQTSYDFAVELYDRFAAIGGEAFERLIRSASRTNSAGDK